MFIILEKTEIPESLAENATTVNYFIGSDAKMYGVIEYTENHPKGYDWVENETAQSQRAELETFEMEIYQQVYDEHPDWFV